MAVSAEVMAMEREEDAQVKRFDVHQMVQHAGLMVSFILLVVTGLPQKFSEVGFSQWWISVLGGIETTMDVHHFSAWVMVVVCVYHALYLVITIAILKRPFPIKMVPGTQDVVNIFNEIRYFVGMTNQRPQFDRFNWREKFDYWAIFWGVPIMAGSGFVLMFPVFVTKYVPGWVVPTALVAHSDEAMLAITWIMIVHVFFNHFVPGLFPLNKSIFTGKVPLHRFITDHPVEYEEMIKTGKIDIEKEK
ncbi:formate dehydrogenase subunit gamma [Chloroflexota bacterium]